jgi:glycine reductase
LEKAGIPVAQVTAMTPVAKAVGSNRIVQARGIVYPLGDAELPANEEKDLRRRIVQQALDALATEGRTTP